MIMNKMENVNSDSPETLQREVYRRRGRRREQRQLQEKQKLSHKRTRAREVTNSEEQEELCTKSMAACVPVQPAKKVTKNELNSATLQSTLPCKFQLLEQKENELLTREKSTDRQYNLPESLVVSEEQLLAPASTEGKEEKKEYVINSKLSSEAYECSYNDHGKQDDDVDLDEDDEDEDVLLLRCVAPLQNASCGVSCIRVGPTNIRVGRSKALCDVVLPPFPGLSRLHCVLSSVGDEISVHDRSSNGTFVNGRCIGRNRCAMLHVHDLLTFIPSGAAHAEECTFTIDATSLSRHQKQETRCKTDGEDDDNDVNKAELSSKESVQVISPSQPLPSLSSLTEIRRKNTNYNGDSTLPASFIVQVSNSTNSNKRCTNDTNFKNSKRNSSTALCPERFAKLVSLSEPPTCSSSVLLSASSDPTLHEEVTTRYALGPVLGQGSFAVVRLGVHHLTKAQVAIKLIDKRHLAKENASHAELLMEAQIMMQIHHRHIVKVLDVYDGVDHIALVMELAREGDLFDYIVGRGRPPFTEREARLLFVQLLEALIYLHSQRVVHNDIKPENVLVMSTRDTNEETVTIAAIEQSSSSLPLLTTKGNIDEETNDSEVHSENSSVCIIKTCENNTLEKGNRNSKDEENSWRESKSKSNNTTVSNEMENASDAFSVVDDHQFQAPCLSPLEVCLKLTDFGAAEFYGNYGNDYDDEENETKVNVQEQIHQRRLWKAYTPMYTAPENEDNADNDEPEEVELKTVSIEDQPMQQESYELQQMEFDKQENGVQDNIKFNNNSNAKSTKKIINTNTADIWSAGILLYVMCTGVLPKKIYNCAKKTSSSSATTSLASNATFTGVEFTKHANHLSDLCKELIHGMLTINPAHRMTLHDICYHAWLHGMRIDGV